MVWFQIRQRSSALSLLRELSLPFLGGDWFHRQLADGGCRAAPAGRVRCFFGLRDPRSGKRDDHGFDIADRRHERCADSGHRMRERCAFDWRAAGQRRCLHLARDRCAQDARRKPERGGDHVRCAGGRRLAGGDLGNPGSGSRWSAGTVKPSHAEPADFFPGALRLRRVQGKIRARSSTGSAGHLDPDHTPQ